MSDYRLWVNDARTVLVRLWESGTLEMAFREHPSHTWGPPHNLEEEPLSQASAGRSSGEDLSPNKEPEQSVSQ